MTTVLTMPPKLRDLFFRPPGIYIPSRYKVARGGRGSAKSWTFARVLLLLATMRPIRALCARELQVSIEDSVHKLLADQIERMGLLEHFEVAKREIVGRNGSEFIFAGIRNNVTKIKSMEGLDVVWVEEAETISDNSWQVLIPTLRKPGSEIWATYNPREESDPTHQRFAINPPPGARVVESLWSDNPWFPAELKAEKDYLYRVDPDAAAWVWGGECKAVSAAQVLRGKYTVEPFEPGPGWDGPYQGADWGFSTDPSAFVRLWIHGRKLYVEREAYGVGVEIDATPALFSAAHPQAPQTVTRADNARPETISYMQRHGWPKLTAADKWQGSVEDGVAFLRSFEQIVIHPRCKHTATEARLWSYKTDRLTGDVLPVLLDKHNHAMDAIRYALQPMIKKRAAGFVTLNPGGL